MIKPLSKESRDLFANLKRCERKMAREQKRPEMKQTRSKGAHLNDYLLMIYERKMAREKARKLRDFDARRKELDVISEKMERECADELRRSLAEKGKCFFNGL